MSNPEVALVTGASRGAGKGIALGLAEKGMTVYVTGRSTEVGSAKGCFVFGQLLGCWMMCYLCSNFWSTFARVVCREQCPV